MKKNQLLPTPALPKSPRGITGLDEITGGGLPTGRPTLVCGSAGCGKTMLALEFLVRGATQFGEPGVFMMFEENAAELTANVRSLGFDLGKLVAQKIIGLEHVHIERSEIEETGEYDLEGLFIRLIEVIDLTKNPSLAAGDQILAVPTLVRRFPESIRKIIGDLSNEECVLVGLDVQPVKA